jgi:hypothetical protein
MNPLVAADVSIFAPQNVLLTPHVEVHHNRILEFLEAHMILHEV